MRKFEIRQGDLTIEGRLERPAFSLLRAEASNFLESLYAGLSDYGVTPNDITLGQIGSLADRNVMFYLPRISAAVKLSVARAEVGFNDLKRVTFAEVTGVSTVPFELLSKEIALPKVADFLVTLNVHGIVEDMNAADFLSGHMGKVPSGLGPPTGGAAGFYYGPEGARRNLAVIMDGSALHAGGVYLRINAGFDAQQLTYAQVLDLGRSTVRQVFTTLGLAPEPFDLGGA